MKRKMVYNYQDLLEYLNRRGVVHKDKPIGWKQSDLCAMADRLIACADGKVFPFHIRFFRQASLGTAKLYFAVDGITYALPADMRSNELTRKVG